MIDGIQPVNNILNYKNECNHFNSVFNLKNKIMNNHTVQGESTSCKNLHGNIANNVDNTKRPNNINNNTNIDTTNNLLNYLTVQKILNDLSSQTHSTTNTSIIMNESNQPSKILI